MAEMKISDLSIGDWVAYNGKKYRIKEISSPYATVTLWGNNEQRDESIVLIEPIPLTPEILEKNGFEELMGKFWVGHNHYCHIQQHSSSWTLLSNKRGFYRTIRLESLEFVHELQHALRLAGVEKEIEV